MYCCTLRHINSIRFLEERLFDFIVFLISQSLCAAIKQLIPIFQGKFLGANCYNRHEPIVTGRIDIFLPFCRDKAVARVYKQRKFVHKFYASLRILPKIQAPIFTAKYVVWPLELHYSIYGGEGSFEAPFYNTVEL